MKITVAMVSGVSSQHMPSCMAMTMKRAGHNAEAKLDALTRDLTRALRAGVGDHALTGPVHTADRSPYKKPKLSNLKFLAGESISALTQLM